MKFYAFFGKVGNIFLKSFVYVDFVWLRSIAIEMGMQ